MPITSVTPISTTVYSDLGFDPTDKQLSVLRQNSSEVGRAWTGAMFASTPFGSRTYQLFSTGFNLGDAVHKQFNGQTQAFNLVPRASITKADVAGIISAWQPKIDSLRADAQQLFRDGELTDGQLGSMLGTLDNLQGTNDRLKGVSALFDRYPNPKKVAVDVR